MTSIIKFFSQSDELGYLVLRPLSHIRANWELSWNGDEYAHEDDSYAELLNKLITELSTVNSPKKYHDNEDALVSFAKKHLKDIEKFGRLWKGGDDHRLILQEGSFSDVDEKNLVLASAGRVKAVISRNQITFDEMEDLHKTMKEIFDKFDSGPGHHIKVAYNAHR